VGSRKASTPLCKLLEILQWQRVAKQIPLISMATLARKEIPLFLFLQAVKDGA